LQEASATGRGEATARGEWIAIAALVVLALLLRLWNLGFLGLVADEGHQALAVQGILAHGYPLLPSDTIYLRGLPFLYAEALVARIVGVTPLALRLPSAIFGALSVALVFALARRMWGSRVAFIAAGITAFSLWELEMSRYARMYTLLQLSFLGAALAFYRGYMTPDSRARPLAFAWAALAILTHQLGLLILGWFVLPLALPPGNRPRDLHGRGLLRLFAPAAGLAVLWFVFHQIEGQLLIRGLTSPPGPDEARGSGVLATVLHFLQDHVLVPPFLLFFERLSADPGIVALAVAIAFLAALPSLAALVRPGRRLESLWALALLGLVFANQIGLGLSVLVAYWIFVPDARQALRRSPLLPAIIGAAVLALTWAGYIAARPEARDPGWGGPRPVLEVLFGYPPVGSRVLSWFMAGWPVMTGIVLVTFAVMITRFVHDRRRTACLALPGFVILLLVAGCLPREMYNESRYHFHLYPFVLIGFAVAVDVLARGVADGIDTFTAILGQSFRTKPLATALLSALFALAGSPDLAPGAIALFVNRDYTTPVDPVRAVLSWRPYATFHQDHEGPALRVRAELAPGDRVVVSGPTYWASIYYYYLSGRVDYAVTEKADRLYRDGQVTHHVTGIPCINSPAGLAAMLEAERDHRVWILGDLNLLSRSNRHFSPEMKQALSALLLPPLYLGRDHDTVVARRDALSDRAGSSP
jgi:hypothetical protein